MTTLSTAMARAWDQKQLVSLLLELTYRCNLDCSFCYNDRGLRGVPLSTEQWRQVLRDAASMGVLNLTLSGGEPLAHPDFFELGALGKALGFVTRIKTNGHALTEQTARRIRDELDPFLLEISLHGATATTHDAQTRVPGSFERLVKHLRGARSVGLRVRLKSVLTRLNEHEVEAMFALADGLGCQLQVDPEVTPRDDGDQSPLSLAPTKDGVRRLFAFQFARARAAPTAPDVVTTVPPPSAPSKHYCGAGAAALTIDPVGNVLACVQWRKPAGSLHEQRLPQLWAGSGVLTEIRGTTREVRTFVSAQGTDAHLLNFCPGRAHTATGSPLKLYPAATARRDAIRDVTGAPLDSWLVK